MGGIRKQDQRQRNLAHDQEGFIIKITGKQFRAEQHHQNARGSKNHRGRNDHPPGAFRHQAVEKQQRQENPHDDHSEPPNLSSFSTSGS